MNTVPTTTEDKVKAQIHIRMREWREWCEQEKARMEEVLVPLMDQPASDLSWEQALSFSRLAFLRKVSEHSFPDNPEVCMQATNLFMSWIRAHHPEEWVEVSEWRDPDRPLKSPIPQTFTLWEDLHLVLFGLEHLNEQ